jgi:hypothetical protein
VSNVNHRAQIFNTITLIGSGLILLVILGCNFLDRQAPSREDFISMYMWCFDEKQIEKIDYDYKGAIGGASTVAKVQFKGPVKMRTVMLEERVKEGKLTLGAYDPDKTTEDDKRMLMNHMTIVTGEMPSWLDFPFNKYMQTIEESSEGDNRKSLPRYYHIWYIDDERNVVYFFGNWG